MTVNTPVDGGMFEFGDNIPFTVTVTDPEDGPIDCAEVEVTFVLGHDTHGHAEASQTGCSGVLHTDRRRRLARRQRVRRDQRDVHRHGGQRAAGADHGRPARRSRQKHQEVEFVVDQSGTHGRQRRRRRPAAAQHRGSLAAGDWIQLNGPFNLLPTWTAITFRVADAAPRAHRRLAAGGDRDPPGPVTGPIVTTATLCRRHRQQRHLHEPDVPDLDSRATHRLFLVFRAVTGGPTARPVQPQLGRVQRSRSRGQPVAPRGRRGFAAPPSSAEWRSEGHGKGTQAQPPDVHRRGGGRGGRDSVSPLGPSISLGHDKGKHKGDRLVPRDRLGLQQFAIRDSITRLDKTVMGNLGGPSFPNDATDIGPTVALPGGFAAVFEYLASVRYTGFEFFSFSNGANPAMTPTEIRTALDNAGLKAAGTHTGGLAAMADPVSGAANRQAQIDMAGILGYKMIGTAGNPANPTLGTLDAWKGYAEQANMVGAAFRAAGIKYFFHPEQDWFRFFDDPAHPELARVHRIDWFTDNTDRKLVNFEPDTMHTLAGRARFPDPVDGACSTSTPGTGASPPTSG